MYRINKINFIFVCEKIKTEISVTGSIKAFTVALTFVSLIQFDCYAGNYLENMLNHFFLVYLNKRVYYSCRRIKYKY